MKIRNRKIDNDEFYMIQREVLNQWSTGGEVNFDEAVLYHKEVPQHKNFSHRLKKAVENGETLTQPRAGVAAVDQHMQLLRYLEDEGEADLLPTTIDSYTRHNRYKEAENGLKESISSGKSMLNGFPAVNYGVAACRRVNEAVGVPVQVRHGTPDARLLAEITLAGGFTSFEGGGISYNIPYAKNNLLERTICDWQYVDRLTGLYEEAGIPVNREPFGPLTGTLVPPCVSHSIAVIESLLAAEQGVRNITVGYGQCGNLLQDVAALWSLEMLTKEYLEKYGYVKVMVTTVLHEWMGGFPQDEPKAFGVIAWGAAAAALAGATKVIVKTPHEAVGIPTKEANAHGLKTTRQMVAMLKDQKMLLTHEIEDEINLISAETRCIVDRAFELGEGDLALGTIRAFDAGIIDVPFAPSRYNRSKALPARDNAGAVRFLDCGDLPFGKDIVEFHRCRMEERARYERREVSFQMVMDDIYAISKGRLVGRPK